MEKTEEKAHIYPIDEVISKLKGRSDNTKVTFFHRYFYREDSPSVVLTIADKAIGKLKSMGVVAEDFTITYNPDKMIPYKETDEGRARRFRMGTDPAMD